MILQTKLSTSPTKDSGFSDRSFTQTEQNRTFSEEHRQTKPTVPEPRNWDQYPRPAELQRKSFHSVESDDTSITSSEAISERETRFVNFVLNIPEKKFRKIFAIFSSPIWSLCHTCGIVHRPSLVVCRVSSVSTITTRNN